jgi:L-fucose isomerase
MGKAKKLMQDVAATRGAVTFGVFATGDPRIDRESRQRAANIVGLVADVVAKSVRMPDGKPVDVVWTPVLVDGEKQADLVARQFRAAGVDILAAP